MSRRQFLKYGIAAGVGASIGLTSGLVFNSKRGQKVKSSPQLIPRFRIQIYSPEWITETHSSQDEPFSTTEFSYRSNLVSSLDVYRNGEPVKGLQNCPVDSLWLKLGDFQEKGKVDYSFNYKGKDGEETRLNIPIHFNNNLEILTTILLARERADNKVFFLDYDSDDLPRRCLVLSNGSINNEVPIHYWIHGIEVLAGISKENFLRYWNSPDKYRDFESFMLYNRFEIKT